MIAYFGKQAHFDEANAILDTYSKEAWGEPKGLVGSRSKAERGVENGKGKVKYVFKSFCPQPTPLTFLKPTWR